MKLLVVIDIEADSDPFKDENTATEFKDEVYGRLKGLEEVQAAKIKVLNIHIDDLPDEG
jgi:hypothetical protein